jgi:hypothetical protein
MSTKVVIDAEEPSSLQRALGVSRAVWLGEVAAIRVDPLADDPELTTLGDACDGYVDHYRPAKPSR